VNHNPPSHRTDLPRQSGATAGSRLADDMAGRLVAPALSRRSVTKVEALHGHNSWTHPFTFSILANIAVPQNPEFQMCRELSLRFNARQCRRRHGFVNPDVLELERIQFLMAVFLFSAFSICYFSHVRDMILSTTQIREGEGDFR
jgi:hypothetical protein